MKANLWTVGLATFLATSLGWYFALGFILARADFGR